MTDDLRLVPLPGSQRPPHATADLTSPAAMPAGSTVQATVVLRRAEPQPGSGAAAQDVEAVTSTLTSLGVQILSADAPSRRVRIEATVAVAERVSGTTLQAVSGADASRVRSGGLSIPATLDGIVVAVLGLDDRRQARAHFRVAAGSATGTSFTPPQLGEIYRFPPDTDGRDQVIAIIELGGGFADSDLDTYFAGLKLDTPSVTAVGVDGASNRPGADPDGADGEVLLDIEVAGALAPKASLVVYFAPNTDDGFLDAVSQAAHASPAPTAMSISWGGSEDSWTEQARTALDEAFADAVAAGCTVTAAAGDDGSSDRATDGGAHVDFPASSPHVLACGGTSLTANGTTVTSETVWNDGADNGATGGGISTVFTRPDWQNGVAVPSAPQPRTVALASFTTDRLASVAARSAGRGVPDVSAVADPRTGYQVLVDGKPAVIGGTSAVAPLWAALIARLAQSLGTKLGLLQPALYGNTAAGEVAPGFRDVTRGNNGAYEAAKGWDPCTGLGVPVGEELLNTLKNQTKK